MTAPGPHAFILVINIVSRYTDQDRKTVKHFEKFFGEELYKYLIVVFAGKDQLEARQMSLEDYIKESPPELQTFTSKCGGRVFALNNMLHGSKQVNREVKLLLDLISENVKRNLNNCYTNEAYEKAEKEIQRQIQERKEQIEEEKRQEMQKLEEKIQKENRGKMDKTLKAEKQKIRKKYEEQLTNVRDDVRASYARAIVQTIANMGTSTYNVVSQVYSCLTGGK